MSRRALALVRYHPLFGSPSWMRSAEAERRLRRDDELYLRLAAAGAAPRQAPRIERTTAAATTRRGR